MQTLRITRRIVFSSLLAFPAAAPCAQPVQATVSSSEAPVPATTPPTPEALGDSLAAHHRYQAAIAAYSRAPVKTAAIWNKTGIAYQMMFNMKDATLCYKESLKLDPGDAQVVNNLATVYASLKMYGQADRMYRKSIKLDPKSAMVWENYGTNLMAEHKYKKGWQAYQQALAIDPEIFAGHSGPTVDNPSDLRERGAMNYYMAAGCARAGNTDCALRYLRMALNEGFTTRKKVASDSEFASLRNNPAFKQLLSEQQN